MSDLHVAVVPFSADNVAARLFVPLGASRIQVSSINIHKGLSQETIAFTATVEFDGKTFTAANHGRGGCNSYHGGRDTIATATDYAEAVTGDDCEPLDTLVYDAIVKRDFRKLLTRAVKKSICFVLPEDAEKKGLSGFRAVSGDDAREFVKATYPHAITLNDILRELEVATDAA